MDCITIHHLAKCSKFKSLSIIETHNKIFNLSVRKKCLMNRHKSNNCYGPYCGVCDGNHHSLLNKEMVSTKVEKKVITVIIEV